MLFSAGQEMFTNIPADILATPSLGKGFWQTNSCQFLDYLLNDKYSRRKRLFFFLSCNIEPCSHQTWRNSSSVHCKEKDAALRWKRQRSGSRAVSMKGELPALSNDKSDLYSKINSTEINGAHFCARSQKQQNSQLSREGSRARYCRQFKRRENVKPKLLRSSKSHWA